MTRLDLTFSPDARNIAIIRHGLSQYNLHQVPELANAHGGEFDVRLMEGGRIVAGAICELDWGYLYFDSVWTDRSVRGKGYGTLIMQAAESFAHQQGTTNAYLFTTTFQARPFYEKLGYQHFGQTDDHPRGHTFFFMHKSSLTQHKIDPRIVIDLPLVGHHATTIESGLLDEIAKTAPLNVRRIAVLLRDENGKIKGGATGISFWDWFDLQFLWVHDSLRHEGWGKKMIAMLEGQLRQRKLVGMRCDTTSFQALPFYQAQGFTIAGTLENRPPGHTSYFLQKIF